MTHPSKWRQSAGRFTRAAFAFLPGEKSRPNRCMVCAHLFSLFFFLRSLVRGASVQVSDGIEAIRLNHLEQCRKGGTRGGWRCILRHSSTEQAGNWRRVPWSLRTERISRMPPGRCGAELPESEWITTDEHRARFAAGFTRRSSHDPWPRIRARLRPRAKAQLGSR